MAYSTNYFQTRGEASNIRIIITNHAWSRMTARGIPFKAVEAAVKYGRVIHARGAEIRVIGRKEVNNFSKAGINLSSYEGIQVVCGHNGVVMTAYRNRDFKSLRSSGSRPARRRYWS